MDLETENRIASILLREAAELRRQAQQEGALAYLRKPTVRGRPNARFLTATVRGIQQVNRAVEVDEMWRVRQKEIELDERRKGRSSDHSSRSSRDRDIDRELSGSRSKRHDSNTSCSSSKRSYEDSAKEEEGLRDEEIEEFLHSRVKRGRGSIGSRMDETGPYLPRSSGSSDGVATDYFKDEKNRKAVVGPEKPSSWKHFEPSDESSGEDERKRSKRKTRSGGSKKKHSKKHKSKEKSKDKKKVKSKRYKH